MKLVLVTDAWLPQVNGVVTTLVELVRELGMLGVQVQVVHPGLFTTRPCPGYAGIDLAVRPKKKLHALLEQSGADAVHIATEGPLGWAARGYCVKNQWCFTTAFHTKFPEILHAALKIPVSWGYALFRHFHRPSGGVMVPTSGVLQMLQARGFDNLRAWTHGVDTNLFAYSPTAGQHLFLDKLPRPISLFVGRVSYEKNIQTFLAMDVPGTKVVCGVGPLEAQLKARYKDVHWMGVLPRNALSKVYAAANIFVFPCRSETFGLVMLEAMACGTPVAAYPVDGPLEVLGQTAGATRGGVLNDDLTIAWHQALVLPRSQARERALEFSWLSAAQSFLTHVLPLKHRK